MVEHDLGDETVAAKERMIDLGRPARVRLVTELGREGEVAPSPCEAGRREQLGLGIRVALLLHEPVAVQRAG